MILRHNAPAALTTGWLGAVAGMSTSVEEVGIPPNQLAAVLQSLLVVPSQVPVTYTMMLDEVPVLPPVEVAVIVMLSAALSLVLIVNVPLDSVLVLSPNVPSPLLSNWALPLLVTVTTVELFVVTVLLLASLAMTVVVKAEPAVSGDMAVTT